MRNQRGKKNSSDNRVRVTPGGLANFHIQLFESSCVLDTYVERLCQCDHKLNRNVHGRNIVRRVIAMIARSNEE